LAQVSKTPNLETFAEASGHPYWDTTMNKEYHSLMKNNTWDLIPLPKGRKLFDVNGFIELSLHQMEVLKDTRFS
jgi:hypothetical protein